MISTSLRARHEMVDVPACHGCDRLVAYGAFAILVLPKGPYPSLPFQGVAHLNAEALFKVKLPLGIIGVCVTFDFDMPFDGYTGSFGEMDYVTDAIFSSAL